jgi:hypothetical protein
MRADYHEPPQLVLNITPDVVQLLRALLDVVRPLVETAGATDTDVLRFMTIAEASEYTGLPVSWFSGRTYSLPFLHTIHGRRRMVNVSQMRTWIAQAVADPMTAAMTRPDTQPHSGPSLKAGTKAKLRANVAKAEQARREIEEREHQEAHAEEFQAEQEQALADVRKANGATRIRTHE